MCKTPCKAGMADRQLADGICTAATRHGSAGCPRVIETNISTDPIGALQPSGLCPVEVIVHALTAAMAESGGRPSSWLSAKAVVV